MTFDIEIAKEIIDGFEKGLKIDGFNIPIKDKSGKFIGLDNVLEEMYEQFCDELCDYILNDVENRCDKMGHPYYGDDEMDGCK